MPAAGRWPRRLLLGALAVALAGCQIASAPVLEVAQARFSNPQVTLAERAGQIERAASGLGWRTERLKPGEIRASLADRGRAAVVRIGFDTATFSVQYEDSRGLGYGGGSIDTAYNGSVAELREAIIAQSGV